MHAESGTRPDSASSDRAHWGARSAAGNPWPASAGRY